MKLITSQTVTHISCHLIWVCVLTALLIIFLPAWITPLSGMLASNDAGAVGDQHDNRSLANLIRSASAEKHSASSSQENARWRELGRSWFKEPWTLSVVKQWPIFSPLAFACLQIMLILMTVVASSPEDALFKKKEQTQDEEEPCHPEWLQEALARAGARDTETGS